MNLGKWGEEIAASFIEEEGMKVIKRNYRTPDGEIDIVAMDGNCLVFLEIKVRRSERFGTPESALNFRKRNQIKKVARQFISHYQLYHSDCRYDLIAIKKEGKSTKVKHIKGAFP